MALGVDPPERATRKLPWVEMASLQVEMKWRIQTSNVATSSPGMRRLRRSSHERILRFSRLTEGQLLLVTEVVKEVKKVFGGASVADLLYKGLARFFFAKDIFKGHITLFKRGKAHADKIRDVQVTAERKMVVICSF